MKISLFSFILLVILYTSIESIIQVNSLTQVNAKCWDYPNPFRPWEKVPSSVCGLQRKRREKERSLDSQVEALTPTDTFQFDFNCYVQDQTLCIKAEDELKSAGTMIANLINFNTPVKVNVTFGKFHNDVIAKAITARTIPLKDDDNIVKQYPQALVKQFLLEPEPQWGDYDINAYFNLHFYYDNNISPDFQHIVLRELIHGFESFSGWENYFNQFVTPIPDDPDFQDLIIKSSNQVTITRLTSSFNILYVFIIALIFFSYT